MENRAEVLIDLGAIRENIKYLMAKSGKPALAVVKADGYGHGLLPVAKSALSAGASWLGVALLEEARALRQGRISAPIIAWLTPITDDFASAIDEDIDIAIASLAHLEAITSASKSKLWPDTLYIAKCTFSYTSSTSGYIYKFRS